MNKFIAFELVDEQKPKTSVWNVVTKQGDLLGQVKWFGRWRQYSFFPEFQTIYERQCLRIIADFCEEQTRLHQERTHNPENEDG